MKTNQLTISSGETSVQAFNKVIKSQFITLPEEKEKWLIILDFPTPMGYPFSFSLEALILLIQNLSKNKYLELFLTYATLPGVNIQKLHQIIGVDDFLKEYNVKLISFSELFPENQIHYSSQEKKKTHSLSKPKNQPKINNIKKFVICTQVRPDLNWGLHGSYSTLYNLFQSHLDQIKQTSFFSNMNLSNKPSSILALIENFCTNNNFFIVINDLVKIFPKSNPLGLKGSKILSPNLILSAKDPLIADWNLYQLGKIKPRSGFLCKFLPFFQKDFKADITLDEKDFEKSNIPLDFSASYDLKEIKIFNFSESLGDLTEQLKSSLYVFKLILKHISIKDITNFPSWHLISGQNPPEPDFNPDTIYFLYGNQAIDSTVNYMFREISKKALREPINILGFDIITGKILGDNELDREIHRKNRKFRKKIIKIRQKYDQFQEDFTKEFNSIQEYPISVKKELLEQEYKKEKQIAKLQYKIEKKRLDIQFRNDKRKIKAQKSDFRINPNVYEIEGSPPNPYQALKILQFAFKSKEIPITDYFIKMSSIYYDYSNINFDFIKEKRKELKESVKSRVKEKNKQIEPKIKEELVELKQKEKRMRDQAKTEYNEKIHHLEKNFQPKIKKIKSEYRKKLKEEYRTRISAFSQKIQNLFFNLFHKKEVRNNNG